MAQRLRSFLLVLLLLSPAALARVISYAPYTDKVAFRGYQSRLARHFVLMESDATQAGPGYVFGGKLVLYDAKGEQEPRVVYPANDQTAPIRFAALYESGTGQEPILLIGTYDTSIQGQVASTRISTDGGRTWRRITELDGKEVNSDGDVDTGGPWTHGLAAPVRIGSAAFPFVVSYRGSVWAIAANGAPRQLAATSPNIGNALVAQNREGTHFVIRTGEMTLVVSDLAGKHIPLESEADQLSQYTGWIGSEGSIYLLRRRSDGRFLSIYRNGQKTFVAGPYGYDREPQNGVAPANDPMSAFAVPTWDFDGAWIIQRGRGKPTTLLLHKPGGALQTMWADVSGPEVEALHAGSSGERLLVQVHRERMVQVPFRDPALAVWKIGEPAPRSYDELFLNEGPTKGFVHVNAETIAAGDVFVFDSGFIQQGWGEPVSPPVGGGGDVVQEWGVVRASLKQRLVLPGVARLPGAFNSYWLTDVVIYNPLDEKQTVDVHFVPLGQSIEIATSTPVVLTLGPREIKVVADVVKSLFAIDNGGGALYFIPQAGVNVTGRTYTKAGDGTFGFGMLAIDFFNAASPRFPLTFAGAFPAQNFRTNVLLTDTSGRGTEARMQAYGVSGTMGASDIAVSAPTNGVTQMNGVAGPLGLSLHQTGGLVLMPTRGTAIATVVAIDNKTNDPTYFPPDLPASMIRTIPVIGHLDGGHGSRFRSDLYLLNLSDTVRMVTLEAKKWDSNEWPRQIRFTMLPNEARVIEDALLRLFAMEGVARLRYWSDGAPGDASGVRVTSRTYNIDANGGTHGCLIPPLNSFQSATAGEALEIVGITGGSGFRTNIGLVELSPGPNVNSAANVRLLVFDDKGSKIDQFTVAVPIAGGMQINDLFAARGLTPPAAARLVIQVLDANSLVGAYATLTDNVTNDSTFLGANLAATPE